MLKCFLSVLRSAFGCFPLFPPTLHHSSHHVSVQFCSPRCEFSRKNVCVFFFPWCPVWERLSSPSLFQTHILQRLFVPLNLSPTVSWPLTRRLVSTRLSSIPTDTPAVNLTLHHLIWVLLLFFSTRPACFAPFHWLTLLMMTPTVRLWVKKAHWPSWRHFELRNL